MKRIEFSYIDGFTYTSESDLEGLNNYDDVFNNLDIDWGLQQANMAYVYHMGWAEDFDNLERAENDMVVLSVDGVVVWSAK